MIINGKEKLSFIENLGTMLGSGIPILEALTSLEEESKGNLKKLYSNIYKDISQGTPLSDSVSKFERGFDPVTINLIKAAEQSGNLDSALNDLAEHIKKDMEFLSKVKSALAYPMLVVGLFTFVFTVILVYVIPRIDDIFSRLKVVMPWPTKVMISMSRFLLANYLYVIAFIIVFALTSWLLYRIKRSFFINLLFSFPFISKLGIEIDIARVSKSLGLLLASGITITKAMELTESVVSRKKVLNAIKLARQSVEGGNPLSDGLKKSKGAFPNLAILVIKAGEKSGTLEQSFKKLADTYELQVSNTLKNITTMLEPVMLILIGFLVGGIMLSIIAPIYQLIGNIKAR